MKEWVGVGPLQGVSAKEWQAILARCPGNGTGLGKSLIAAFVPPPLLGLWTMMEGYRAVVSLARRHMGQ